MAHFAVDPFGNPLDDRVRIALNGTDLRIFEQYEVKHSFFSAPSAFACRIGSGDLIRELTGRYPPNTRYEVRVGPEIIQHTGRLDGYSPEDSTGATELSLRGRDSLTPLVSSFVVADRSFSNVTFIQLVEHVLTAVGISSFSIVGDNTSNRNAVSGVTKASGSSTGIIPQAAKAKPLQAKTGEQWHEFLLKELRRAGLFLFASHAENEFVVAQPNTTQAPLYNLFRQRGAPTNAVTVLSARHQNDTSRRYARYIVRGRAGGSTKKAGRPQLSADVADDEMVALGFPPSRAWAKVDAEAKNEKRAEFLARRQMAEDRRQGWNLSYTVRGHTAPVLGGGAEERAVWAVDTMVRVRDDEYGINGDFWIESATLRGSMSGTTTELALHRPADLIFGEPDFA